MNKRFKELADQSERVFLRWNNVNRILREVPKITITFMVTYNMLSVFSFDKLIKGIYQLKND